MNTEFQFEGLPLPAFKLTKNLELISCSQEARHLFGSEQAFLNVVDEGSVNKVLKLLETAENLLKFELNVVKENGELLLADFYGKWESDSVLSVILVPKEDTIERISLQLRKLQNRLRETDYDLFQEKELTTQLLHRVQLLSAPSIRLDSHQMLIPLFGDLTAEKISAVQETLLKEIHDSLAETVIVDFTAVDQIEQEGLQLWHGLVQSFSVMGISCIVTGVKPNHAKRLHELETDFVMHFASSLLEVLAANHSSRL